jgi:hypothetical protein
MSFPARMLTQTHNEWVTAAGSGKPPTTFAQCQWFAGRGGREPPTGISAVLFHRTTCRVGAARGWEFK